MLVKDSFKKYSSVYRTIGTDKIKKKQNLCAIYIIMIQGFSDYGSWARCGHSFTKKYSKLLFIHDNIMSQFSNGKLVRGE